MIDAENPQLPEPVLVVGADGMLGRAWCGLLSRLRVPHEAPSLADLDLTRPETLRAVAAGPWRVVVNCAAWTDVDGAEANEDRATAINGIGVAELARACRSAGAMLVHYSTDYVFDGRATEPIPVDAPRRPLGAYGRSKAKGEEAIEASGCRFLIARTSWLYAPWGKNFVRTIRALLTEKPLLKVVNDQRGRPTSAAHLALTTARLIDRGAEGLWHVTDGGECTWFEFASEIAAQTPGACPVEPCSTSEFPRPAPRPAYSVLDISETERMAGVLPHWRENLADVMNRLKGEPVPAR